VRVRRREPAGPTTGPSVHLLRLASWLHAAPAYAAMRSSGREPERHVEMAPCRRRLLSALRVIQLDWTWSGAGEIDDLIRSPVTRLCELRSRWGTQTDRPRLEPTSAVARARGRWPTVPISAQPSSPLPSHLRRPPPLRNLIKQHQYFPPQHGTSRRAVDPRVAHQVRLSGVRAAAPREEGSLPRRPLLLSLLLARRLPPPAEPELTRPFPFPSFTSSIRTRLQALKKRSANDYIRPQGASEGSGERVATLSDSCLAETTSGRLESPDLPDEP
jgi:hypothetical protein